MKKEDIHIGRRYWYRWCYDSSAESAVCIGLTEESVVFDRNSLLGDARVVKFSDIHCEDVTTAKKAWWRFWE